MQDAGRAVALLPSLGMGGGIERYAGQVLDALLAVGWEVRVIPLANGPNTARLSRKLRFVLSAYRACRSTAGSGRLFAFHPSFATTALVLRLATHLRRRPIVFFYGQEIWSAMPTSRWLWKRAPLEFVTISSFSAGALANLGRAQIITPAVSKSLFGRLDEIARARPSTANSDVLRVCSVFRLEAAESKGAYRLLSAIEGLRQEGYDITLVLAGKGPVPRELGSAVQRWPWATLRESPSDEELAGVYAEADLFVLATAMRRGRITQSGEGFGLVAAEAALAGLAVIMPGLGGSPDTFIDGVTGLALRGESVHGLQQSLRWAADNRSSLMELGRRGHDYARRRFPWERLRSDVAEAFEPALALGPPGRRVRS